MARLFALRLAALGCLQAVVIAQADEEDCTAWNTEAPKQASAPAARCLLQSQKSAEFLLDTLPGQKRHSVMLVDPVVPGKHLLSPLGIQAKSGVVALLPEGSALPAESTVIMTSSKAQQTDASIRIMSGDSVAAKTNLQNMPSLALHEHRIEITIRVDASCNLEVHGNADLNDSNSESALLLSRTLTICASGDPEPPLFTKKGIICMEKTGCDKKNMEAMRGHVSWFYTYAQRFAIPDEETGEVSAQAQEMLQFANDNSLEFTPMIKGRYMYLKDGAKCYFANRADINNIPDGSGNNPDSIRELANCTLTRCCEDGEIYEMFDQLIAEMTVRPKYLLAFNEPYVQKKGQDYKNIPAKEAADYFRLLLQPIAEKYNFQIVSPSSGPETTDVDDPDDGLNSGGKMTWLADFMDACWDARKMNPPCKIETMTKVALHKYTCKSSYWEKQYGDLLVEGGTFNQQLKALLKARKPNVDFWDSYVDSLRYWVTETNCNWDGSKDNGPSPTVQCTRITGQGGSAYGEGSLKTLERMDLIERYAWWNLYNGKARQMTQVARMTAQDGSLTPIGRAYTNDLSSETGCNRLDNTFRLARFEEGYVCAGDSTSKDLGKHKVDDNCLEACKAEGEGVEQQSWCCGWSEFSGLCTYYQPTEDAEVKMTIDSVSQKMKFAAIFPPRDFNSIEW